MTISRQNVKEINRYLAFDLGEKRIGLAVSDEMGITAQRLPFMERKSEKENLAYIGELVREYKISTMVIGLPRHMSGDIGKGAEEALEFAEKLKKEFNLPAVTWDERLTTLYAERSLKDLGVKGKKRRRIIDSVSAQLILQSYLDSL